MTPQPVASFISPRSRWSDSPATTGRDLSDQRSQDAERPRGTAYPGESMYCGDDHQRQCYDNVEMVVGLLGNGCARRTGSLQCVEGAAELVIRSHVKVVLPSGGKCPHRRRARRERSSAAGTGLPAGSFRIAVRAGNGCRPPEPALDPSLAACSRAPERLPQACCRPVSKPELHGEPFDFSRRRIRTIRFWAGDEMSVIGRTCSGRTSPATLWTLRVGSVEAELRQGPART